MYQHCNWQGESLSLPTGKVVCVGSNYAKHIAEMGSRWPEEPLLFIKPDTALCSLTQPVELLQGYGDIHHETELAILIGKTLSRAQESEVMQGVFGYGIALDLTLRQLQSELKSKGQPWEKAKGFDRSCPISGFIPAAEFGADPEQTDISLWVNDELRQQGNSSDMVFSVTRLLAYISQFFTLKPGDIVLTGTPSGVGPLNSGDRLRLQLAQWQLHSHVG